MEQLLPNYSFLHKLKAQKTDTGMTDNYIKIIQIQPFK